MFKNIFHSDQKEEHDHIFLSAYIAEFKEWDNRTHLERMKRYIYLLSLGLGLNENEAKLFSISGLLHDVGKISIPTAILNKTDKLKSHEWIINEGHTIEGAKLLSWSSSEYFKVGEIIALSHHERWDGSGYPEGLSGEDIPLCGRICAVADVFDALTSKRNYKKEISNEEAFKLIVDSSGSLFDPEIISVFTESYIKLINIKENVK